jgi:hypothetical protein
MIAEPLFKLPPFSLNKQDKQATLLPMLQRLMQQHQEKSTGFARISSATGFRQQAFTTIADVPFLPVSVFKNHDLKSIADTDVFKMLTSSGTTGQQVSKIYLDKQTASLQTSALAHIITSIIGQERLPMLIIDSKSVLRNRESFSARGAGILGLSVFGKQHTYLLDNNYELNVSEVNAFLEKHNGQPMLLFGFTFIVWQYLFQLAEKTTVDLSKAILFHSGGWKKMSELSVTNEVFKQRLKEQFGLHQVYNFYGMVEQTGSIFIENSKGYLHCSNFSDIIIRNPYDFSEMPHGEKGLIQVISVLPESYPGFSLLTEDIGICHGEDASNNWKGKYFEIIGRAAKAELRGCSDTTSSPSPLHLSVERNASVKQASAIVTADSKESNFQNISASLVNNESSSKSNKQSQDIGDPLMENNTESHTEVPLSTMWRGAGGEVGEVQQLCPQNILLPVAQLPCFIPQTERLDWFDDHTVDFLNQLSIAIVKTGLRQLPAMVALAYWLRKSNIEKLRRKKVESADNQTTLHRQPLGTVFHVCPGNVDTIFLYSLAISLLAGNRNVLRISNRVESTALKELFHLMNEVMQKSAFTIFNQYITIITYGHNEEINCFLSLQADARIIWGGDKAVQLFRSLPTAPRCRDIAFPDRLSVSIIKAESLLQLNENDFTETCRLLYNDAYVFDQLGCSSPQAIFFMGEPETAMQAEDKLYNGLLQQSVSKYNNEIDGLASLKLNKLTDDAINETIVSSKRENNLLVFATLKNITNDLHTCGGGYLYTATIQSVNELSGFFSKKIQTAAYFGLTENEKLQLVKVAAGKGLDRLVPVGQALTFNNYWDGYDLLEQLTQLTVVI